MPLSQEELSLVLRRLVHDLRGPLINVRMSLEVLVSMDDAAERQNLGNEVDKEMGRLDALIEDTAQLAQAASMKPAETSLNAVLAQFAAERPGLQLALPEEARAVVEPDKLARLLAILHTQAVQGGADEVRLQLAALEGGWEIRLEHNGQPYQVPPPGSKIDLQEAFLRLVADGHAAQLHRDGKVAVLKLGLAP